jgi:hypothetical protein
VPERQGAHFMKLRFATKHFLGANLNPKNK